MFGPQKRDIFVAPLKQLTTPGLTEQSDLAFYLQMERDLGGNSEAIGDLKAKVYALEKLRADPDRKDIDDLKDFRSHTVWLWTFIAGAAAVVISFLSKFGGTVWEEMLKPRIKKILA